MTTVTLTQLEKPLQNVVPEHRGPQDEAAGREEFVHNMADEAYRSWPNEAGFDNLVEERGPLELEVKGDIPSWALGTLFRTGPGGSKVEDTPNGTHYVSHWFDGFAHTHRFDILPPKKSSDNKVRVVYSSRRQAEDLVEEIKSKGWGNHFSFGQRRDPCIGMFGKIMSVFQKTPSGRNVQVVVNLDVPGLASKASTQQKAIHSGDAGHRKSIKNVWITTDATPMVEIDSETLEPVGAASQASLHPDLKGPSSCAHAQRDPETGDLFNFNLDMARTVTYRVFRVNAATGTTDILATISDSSIKAAYMHSFFLTQNYVVLCIPISHYMFNGISIPWQRNLLDSIQEFDESKKCKWLVVDRRGNRGLVATFDSPAGFFFHSINAFDEPAQDGSGTDVYCDVAEYPNQDVMRSFYYDVLMNRNEAATQFWNEKDRVHSLHARYGRYRLRIPATKTNEPANATSPPFRGAAGLICTVPSPHAGELPTINPAYQCKRQRYVYSLANRGRSTLLDTIVKTDTETRGALLWACPHAHTPGEAIFVPREPASDGDVVRAEDDGVLLSVVLDGSAQRSYLLCLDARTMTELGRAECPFAIGLGFHGVHAPTGVN